MTGLDNPIEYLKGVGPVKAALLRSELGVTTFGDLLCYFPFRHIDRSKFYFISEVDPNAALVQVKGCFTRIDTVGAKRAVRLVGVFQDAQGATMEVVWFRGIVWLRQSIKTGEEYVLFGKPSLFNGKLQMTHPETEPAAHFESALKGGLEGVYNTTEKLKARKLDSRAIRKLMEKVGS